LKTGAVFFDELGWIDSVLFEELFAKVFYIAEAHLERGFVNITIGLDKQFGSFAQAHKPDKIINRLPGDTFQAFK
jgi:hypothetical protein